MHHSRQQFGVEDVLANRLIVVKHFRFGFVLHGQVETLQRAFQQLFLLWFGVVRVPVRLKGGNVAVSVKCTEFHPTFQHIFLSFQEQLLRAKWNQDNSFPSECFSVQINIERRREGVL